MAILNWKTSPEDRATIVQIAERAVSVYSVYGQDVDQEEVEMDITATHNNGTPLRLSEMLAADDFNLMHDIGGIYKHINRDTGKLEGFFVPRFAA